MHIYNKRKLFHEISLIYFEKGYKQSYVDCLISKTKSPLFRGFLQQRGWIYQERGNVLEGHSKSNMN